MGGFGRLANAFMRKMENYATAEALRLGKHVVRTRLIGITIGIVVVILLALWMAHH